jgi:hypothetical protein
MAFHGYICHSELAMLSAVLDEYCSENGIRIDSVEREDVAALVILFFERGADNMEALTAGLHAHRAKARASA